MKATQFLFGLAALGSQLVLGQSPEGFTPRVKTSIGLTFPGQDVEAGTLINQAVADAGQPTVSAAKNYTGTYVLALVDLKIPPAALPADTDFSTLTPGLGANRTTRLHWWEYNVKRSYNGVLRNQSVAIADYEGPQPPSGDEPHYYVLFLFNQPSGFAPPAGAREYYADTSSEARMNFSVPALAEQLGQPIAANYFRVEYDG